MRYPDKERRPFSDPCWTADDIASYTGPIFRATVEWMRDDGGKEYNDHECPSMKVLHKVVRDNVEHLRAKNRRGIVVTYGIHTEPERKGKT